MSPDTLEVALLIAISNVVCFGLGILGAALLL